MKQLMLGIGVLFFGLFIGGVGVATAGIGIGVPMVPIGIYLTYRGWRIYRYQGQSEHQTPESPAPLEPLEPLEKTRLGKVAIGILLILVGLGTSADVIGVPILIAGLWFIYKANEIGIKKIFNK